MNNRSLLRHALLAILLGVIFYKSISGYWTLWLVRYQAACFFLIGFSVAFSLVLRYSPLQRFLLIRWKNGAQSNIPLFRLFYAWLSCSRCIIFWIILIFSGVFWYTQLPGLMGVFLIAFLMANLMAALQIALFLYL
jgi:hypothetical protein